MPEISAFYEHVHRKAGFEVDNGILVDDHSRTSGPDIFAVSDCINHPCTYLGRRLRLESAPSALEQARAAAATIVGKSRPYTSAPGSGRISMI
jgi:3-phenylpropionate/trans-cinnamate dioxygenase ferredoxin reductase component